MVYGVLVVQLDDIVGVEVGLEPENAVFNATQCDVYLLGEVGRFHAAEALHLVGLDEAREGGVGSTGHYFGDLVGYFQKRVGSDEEVSVVGRRGGQQRKTERLLGLQSQFLRVVYQ